MARNAGRLLSFLSDVEGNPVIIKSGSKPVLEASNPSSTSSFSFASSDGELIDWTGELGVYPSRAAFSLFKFPAMKALLPVLAALCAVNLVTAQEMPAAISPASHVELFNGRDFTGWTFSMKNGADPLATWSVTNGVIHCTGQPTGFLRTEQSYQNYVLTVEWRFLKVTPKFDNTGVLVNMQLPDKVWPKCVQVQGKHLHQGDLFLMMGAESKEHLGMNPNTPLPLRGGPNEHPVGEWDMIKTVVMTTNGPAGPTGTVTAYVNGRLMNETTECTVTNGFIGIQSEGADIEIRKMSLDPLPN